jgi:3-oxoadipate enol-lactonase
VQLANINGHLIHYKHLNAKEKGRTLVFLNSVGTDYRIWDDVVDIVKDHASILLLDNRGHGLSDVVEDTRGLNDFVTDTAVLLDHLSINHCTIIGLSLGGMIAKLMATHLPHKVENLVLCDTGFVIGNPDFWNNRITAVKENGLPAVSASVMLRCFSDKFRQEKPTRVLGYRNMLERMPADGYIKACEAIRDADLKSIASKIRHRTLCIVGSEDQSTTPEEVKELASLIDGSAFSIIEGSGHLPCIENPKALSRLILDFI